MSTASEAPAQAARGVSAATMQEILARILARHVEDRRVNDLLLRRRGICPGSSCPCRKARDAKPVGPDHPGLEKYATGGQS